MTFLDKIQGVDIQLIDQLLKGRLTKESSVLDAGCGSGRNSLPLLKQGFNVVAFDPNPICKDYFSAFPESFCTKSIADFSTSQQFDFMICNAVLHFSENHIEFEEMFSKLTSLLSDDGVLFIRMTSDLAFRNEIILDENGRCLLPDGSQRYLLTEDKLGQVLIENSLKLIDLVKTVNVQNLRCMTTLVLGRG